MRGGAKIIRLCALLAAFMALSAMAGCPESSDFQDGNRRTEGPPDHSGPVPAAWAGQWAAVWGCPDARIIRAIQGSE
jgi:hypothetical protein